VTRSFRARFDPNDVDALRLGFCRLHNNNVIILVCSSCFTVTYTDSKTLQRSCRTAYFSWIFHGAFVPPRVSGPATDGPSASTVSRITLGYYCFLSDPFCSVFLAFYNRIDVSAPRYVIARCLPPMQVRYTVRIFTCSRFSHKNEKTTRVTARTKRTTIAAARMRPAERA